MSEDTDVQCPVCGRAAPGDRIAIVASTSGRYGIRRCRRCQTVIPEHFAGPQDLPDAAIDERAEYTASVDGVLLTLMRVQPRRDLRFLDLGCGYGYALDLARFAWGWEGIGVDPSNLAIRGRDELGVDIRATTFDSDLDLGEAPFDVVLASEALEHVPDPRLFLEQIKERLAPDGVLVLSTPNAQLVTPTTPAKQVVAALGLGSHVYLVGREGLEQLLRDAGFGAFEIDEDDPLILRAVASPTAAGLKRCVPASSEPDLRLLVRYCDGRADAAPEGSALRLGMAVRSVEYAIHAGDLAAASSGRDRLRAALLERYGIDVEDPSDTSSRTLRSDVPLVVAQAHFSVGFLELEAGGRPARAAKQFAAAAAVANSALGNSSPAPLWLQLRSIGHEALAYARSEPSRAPRTLRRLRNAASELVGRDVPEVDALCAQVYSELVARGHFDAADEARSLVKVSSTDAPTVGSTPAAGRASRRHDSLRVSVVLPLYNGAAHIAEAIASVVGQTRPSDELVVVDDGSTDDGIALLQKVSAPFPIRLVRQKRAGQSAARNRGVAAVTGDLLAFLDQDDTWHAEHLQVLCRPFMENAAVGWVYSDFDEIDAAGQTVTLSFLAERAIGHPRRSLEACLGENLMVIPSATVIRRTTFEALGGFDEELQGYEDDDLYVRAFRHGTPMVFEPRSLTCFRVHPVSSSANGRFAESRLNFTKKLRQTVADDPRLNRYYFRDVIAPRFFHESLDDYVRAVSDKDWATARRRYEDMEYFAHLHRDHAALRWKMALIRNPELFRRLLQASDSIPVRPRSLRHPLLRLRHRDESQGTA